MPLNNKISTQVKYILKNDSMSTFLKQNFSQKWSWVWEMVLICLQNIFVINVKKFC